MKLPADIITSRATFNLSLMDRLRLLWHGRLQVRMFAETTQEVGEASVTLEVDVREVWPAAPRPVLWMEGDADVTPPTPPK